MSMIDVVTDLGQAAASARYVFRFFGKCWSMLRERWERDVLRGALYDLDERDRRDIGTTRGEIEYVVRSGSIDPRGARSA